MAKRFSKLGNIKLDQLNKVVSDPQLPEADRLNIDNRFNEILRERVKSFFSQEGEDVLKRLDGMVINYEKYRDLSFSDLIEKEILPQLDLKPDQLSRTPLTSDLQINEKVGSILNLDLPLRKNPWLTEGVRQVQAREYAKIAGISQEKIRKLDEYDFDPSVSNPELLEKFQAENILTQQEARSLHLSFELGKLTDDNIPLVEALQSTSIKSVSELVSWDERDWESFILKDQVRLPSDESLPNYISNLVENLAVNFPSSRMLAKVQKGIVINKDQWNPVLALAAKNPDLFNHNDTEIDWTGKTREERKNLTNGIAEIKGFLKGYRHLGIDRLLIQSPATGAVNLEGIQQRLNHFTEFVKRNADFDLLSEDLTEESSVKKINWEGIAEADKNPFRQQLMAYQRAIHLGGPDSAVQLVSRGFDSSAEISEMESEDFYQKSGLAKEEADKVWSAAAETTAATSHLFEAARVSLKDIAGNGLHVANWLTPDFTNKLKALDGFDELFGSQDYCNCAHCKSIFSPAAYFVDLMYFIEKNISNKVFATRKTHALFLKNRRPDLWKLVLSCENTNGLIPYLDVVNEVLESYLQRALSVSDVYKKLLSEQISFNLPFNLYAEETRTYLGHFNISLFDVYKILNNSNEEIWREKLRVSTEEWMVLSNPDVSNNVRKRIGDPGAADFAKFDVKEFVRYAGITRSNLDQLLDIDFTRQLKNITITKEQSVNPVTDPLINYVERLNNLDNVKLDFIHRFVRLWKKTPWSIPEFDMLLCSLKSSGLINITADADQNGILDKQLLIQCARLLDLSEKLRLKSEELPPMIGEFSGKSISESKPDLFVRLFTSRFLDNQPFVSFHHSFVNSDGITDPKLGFLLGGLGVSEGELIQLFELLKTEIVFDGSGNTVLNRKNISLLFRHARIAKSLKLSIEELILVLQLQSGGGNGWIDSVGKIYELIEFRDRLQLSKLKVFDIWFMLTGIEKGGAGYKITDSQVESLLYGLQKKGAVFFESSFLKDVSGVTAEESVKIVQEMVNLGWAKKKSVSEELYRLESPYQQNQDFSPLFSTMGASPSVVSAEDSIREKVNYFHSKNIIQRSATGLLNLTNEAFEKLLAFVDSDLSDATTYQAIYAVFDDQGKLVTPSDMDAVVKAIRQFEKVAFTFQKTGLVEEDFLFVASNPALFGISDPRKITVDVLFNYVEYRKFVSLNLEWRSKAQLLLQDYQAAGSFTSAQFIFLSELWKLDVTLIQSVCKFIPLPSGAMEAIVFLGRCLTLCKTIGINGESFSKLKETDFTKLKDVRDIVVGAFASKYPDEEERNKKLEPYHDRINTRKRDALCDFIIAHQKELKFTDMHDLYAYFLLDVEMSGCFRTSRVVAAISSLQLYVFRCLMNLEQSGVATIIPDGNNDPDDDAYEFVKVLPSMVPAEEWEWRKNYRVWEANRKVFLYPENYILPELRDDKTNIFKELEDELLQEKITEESAGRAYQKYLAQFSELARLRVAGTYYDQDSNTYYFFGKTNVDPPQYYYRTWEKQKVWTAWRKIELGINSTNVSAIKYAGKLYLFWTEIKVKEETSVSGGNSSSSGFVHKLEILYSSLDESGRWSAAQRFYFSERVMPSDLTLGGVMNRKTFPAIKDNKLYLFYSDADFTASLSGHRRLDLYNNKLIGSDFTFIPKELLMPVGTDILLLKGGSSISLIPDKGTWERQEARADDELVVSSSPIPAITSGMDAAIYQPEIGIVGRKYSDFVLKAGNQQFLIQKRSPADFYFSAGIQLSVGKILWPSKWRMTRISTSLADKLGEKLFLQGVDQLLKLDTQKWKEDLAPFSITDTSYLSAPYSDPNHLDFSGSYGRYYWELFFHIPFLIASHLNADNKFKEADWWYRKIFNPTSTDVTNPEKERNWQFIMFRGLGNARLQDILTDSAAIEAYKSDPFNPHAIARLRLSAYQKTIVMKYIDNLLDWGDSLFAQDTMESINEATMLYVMASDILGKRPVKLGDCESAGENQLTYDNLGPAIAKGSEFLIQLENYLFSAAAMAAKFKLTEAFATNKIIDSLSEKTKNTAPSLRFNEEVFNKERVGAERKEATVKMEKRVQEYASVSRYEQVKKLRDRDIVFEKARQPEISRKPPHWGIVKQKLLAFCIPNNEELLKYWDRVEDRLFKIRNCMNISGVRRSLALFQPPIDPMMLVKARAAGLSLEDILSSLNKPLPHYRFTYLLEKARQSAQMVQNFATSLLSAMEKKDAEELLLIRSVNEKEILNLTTQNKKNAIAEAQNQWLAATEKEQQVQISIDWYNSLVENGLTGWEVTQQITKHVATAFKLSESVVHLMAGITYLIPQVGSPFSMKYGGKELGDSGAEFSLWTSAMANILDAVSNSAGLEAGFQRREEEWKHQLESARQEIKTVQKEKLAAEYKTKILERDLEIHEKELEHNQEIEDFYKRKLTGMGLYNFLATNLTRLHREAYNTAYDLARLAEQAYQFEKDDTTVFIAPDNWTFDKSGLLSAEKLLLQLNRMEKTYIEVNRRDYEISQSISMLTWAPEKLTELKQKGSCTFEIPELAYDLFYPGQYRRLIKSVRLTIPCVSGPFANISCKLSLVESKLRKEPVADGELVTVPAQKLTSIATSTAQSDSGLFELNFRDERLLPFEGAGAISTWRLELPGKVRSFDYSSIADVIFQISFTAKDDGLLRETVEQNIATAIEDYSSTNGLFRIFSLRHEFPDTYYRFLSGSGTPKTAEFEIRESHFPYLFNGNDLSLSNLKVFLKPAKGVTLNTTGANLNLNAFGISAWSDFPNDGSVAGDLLLKEGSISANGSPIKKWTMASPSDLFDKDQIDDIILVMKYSVS